MNMVLYFFVCDKFINVFKKKIIFEPKFKKDESVSFHMNNNLNNIKN